MSNPYAAPNENATARPPEDLVQSVRGVKIVTVALAAGVLIFLGIALAVTHGEIRWQPDLSSWMAIAMAALMIVLHGIIPNTTANAALSKINSETVRGSDEAGKRKLVVPVFVSRHIVACALLEGAAFFNVVVYIISRFGGNLIATAVLVVLIAFRLPTISGVQFWVQDRVREIERR